MGSLQLDQTGIQQDPSFPAEMIKSNVINKTFFFFQNEEILVQLDHLDELDKIIHAGIVSNNTGRIHIESGLWINSLTQA